MQRHPSYTRARLQQFGAKIRGLIYSQRQRADAMLVSPAVDRISFAAAQKLAYKPAKIGDQFGPPWATFWFRIQASVPKEWAGRRVDLLWNSQSEATLWIGGRTIQGLNEHCTLIKSQRPDATLLKKARGGEKIAMQIEMACNAFFGLSFCDSAPGRSAFWLEQCDIAAFDAQAWELYHDYLILQELEAEINTGGGANDKTWGGLLLSELNRFINAIDLADRKTWAASSKILKSLYRNRNASTVHELSAIGHAHIDTAWLWPLGETRRKCERTFSSQIAYMDSYPEYKFACSQAYQYDLIKSYNPELYRRIKQKIKTGQFIPVGGTWIEPDCNIPSGEALARQFLYGQRFFQKEFGITCREFWNPDVFGYNGQLPQIMRLAGMTRFLTMKLSWNRFNKPPHHTFMWQGIDGSEVLAHFPPADTYNSRATVGELVHNARNYKDHDRSKESYLLFGFGDGGGGPTRGMLESLRRAKDLQGLPRTTMRSSNDFFARLERDYTDRVRQVGELYFELHRGTYTTQAATKKGNRKCEFLLHDVEFLATVAARLTSRPYPQKQIESLWKVVLLNQFHDILPGSSITLVYEDNKRDLEQVTREATTLRTDALASLVKKCDSDLTPINTIGFDRHEVAQLPDGSPVYVEAPSYGVGKIVATTPDRSTLVKTKNVFILENAHLRAKVNADGSLASLVEKKTGQEALSGPGNQLLIYRDEPNEFEGWDVDPQDLETEKPCPPAHSAKVMQTHPLRAAVAFERKVGLKSTLNQMVSLSANARRLEFHTQVDWQESKKHIKVAFPVNVRAMDATYEMQFGNAQRPTHYNTMYDLARFEVPGHKWADLSQRGFGVALLSESKYGFSTLGNIMRISLLRATNSPDPVADLGHQEFAYAIMPHAGDWREAGVVGEGYRFNVPVLFAPGIAQPRCFAGVDDPNLVLDTIKKAEDGTAMVLRMYECHGAAGTARVKVDLPFKSAVYCNFVEEEGAKA